MNGLDAERLCAGVISFTETAQGIVLELETVLSQDKGDAPRKSRNNGELPSEDLIFKA